MAQQVNQVVAAIQTGNVEESPQAVIENEFKKLEKWDKVPDLVAFPELFSFPFWCVGLSDPKYFEWAEKLDGTTITTARKYVKRLGCHAVVPFFEKGELEGEYYNSAVLIDPGGDIVEGVLPSGEKVLSYRKVAISSFNWDGMVNDEKYYFRSGAGYPIFSTRMGKIGILICYDRWFPEAWRVLSLSGAEIICVLNTSTGIGKELFIPYIRACSAQNIVYSVATNRKSVEKLGEVSVEYFGESCVVGPRGEVLATVKSGEGLAGEGAIATIDLSVIGEVRTDVTMYRDRRPDLYGMLIEQ